MKVITETDVKYKKVLVRGDLDVPVEGQNINNDFRLQAILPTLNHLIKNQARVILIGHLGRPQGKVAKELKLKPIADWLMAKNFSVSYEKGFGERSEDCLTRQMAGSSAARETKPKNSQEKRVNSQFLNNEDLETGEIALLENLRFDSREKENSIELAQELAKMADIFVNECFASSHRKHTSIVSIPKHLPSFAGIHFAKEVQNLSQVLKNPARPFLFIMGGAKNETKIPLVKKFSKIADTILLGGTLMFAQKLEGVPRVRFPVDAIRIDDIGPKSIALFKKYIQEAETIVWNGPLGRFEEEEFSQGTREVAQAISNSQAFSLAGGGDTIAALEKFGLKDKIDFVSTGGGAMLEFLAKGTLPGIKALEENA